MQLEESDIGTNISSTAVEGMISRSELKSSRVANSTKTNKCKVVKGTRPLVNFKFYLDIANHHISLKLETKIKELGGSIEFFFTESVTHFITDKLPDKELTGTTSSPCTPPTPQTLVLSNCEKPSSNGLKGDQKIKSRANAMLHRARKGIESVDKLASVQRSPTQVAKSRGKPIWGIDTALKFLEKANIVVKKHYKNGSTSKIKQKIGNAKILKGNFIKIEASQHHFRPYYQLITNGKWPTLSLNSHGDLGVFQYANESCNFELKNQEEDLQEIKTNSLEMTRKSRSSKHIRVKSDKKIPSEKQCGYCEICRVEYDVLTNHLKTDQHINFVKNDSNFLELDSLIKSNTNMDTFLAISKDKIFKGNNCEMYSKRSSKRIIVGSQVKSSIVPNEHKDSRTNDSTQHARQTRQSSVRQSVNFSLFDNQINNTGIVRSRRESVKKVNYTEPNEDEENSSDIIIGPQRTKKIPEIKNGKSNIGQNIDSSPLRPKPKLPLLYKVVAAQDECSGDKKEPLSEKINEQALKLKVKKIRQNQLSVLNGEAENFMFPKKLLSEISTDTDRQTTSESGGTSSSIISSEKVMKRKSSISSHTNVNLDDSEAPKKRKNSSQQNIKTVLNVSSQSKILEQSFRRSPIHPRRKNIRRKRFSSNNNIVFENLSDNGMGEIKASNLKVFIDGELNQYKFSFERIPHAEIWYQVFHRQDESKEKMFEYYGNTAYRKLPYEMGPLPPLQPTICQLCLGKDVVVRSSEDSKNKTVEDKKLKEKKVKNPNIVRKRSKSKNLLSLEMPRKSPREHASTLAILSCLIQQRSAKANQEQPDITKMQTGSEEKSQKEINESKDKSEQLEKPEIPEKIGDDISLNVSTQISENVKRLRRTKKLKSFAGELAGDKMETETKTYSTKRKYRKKQLEFNIDGKNLYSSAERYINVNKLKHEIDCHLLNSFVEYEELEDISVPLEEKVDQFSFDFSLQDIILDNSTKNDKNICGRTKAAGNKLRLFNIFSTNKKRKNKTGWPTKKRVATRQQFPNLVNFLPSIERCSQEAIDDVICNKSSITPLETDTDEKIRNSVKITKCKEDAEESLSYFSLSEKADNSDILTVSSDSLDTVLDVGSQMKSKDQQEVIASSKSNINLSNINRSDKRVVKNIYKRKYNKNRRPMIKRAIGNIQKHDCKIKVSDQLNENLREISDSIATICEEKNDSLKRRGEQTPSVNLSPRRLRKPRGKWYRER